MQRDAVAARVHHRDPQQLGADGPGGKIQPGVVPTVDLHHRRPAADVAGRGGAVDRHLLDDRGQRAGQRDGAADGEADLGSGATGGVGRGDGCPQRPGSGVRQGGDGECLGGMPYMPGAVTDLGGAGHPRRREHGCHRDDTGGPSRPGPCPAGLALVPCLGSEHGPPPWVRTVPG